MKLNDYVAQINMVIEWLFPSKSEFTLNIQNNDIYVTFVYLKEYIYNIRFCRHENLKIKGKKINSIRFPYIFSE